MQRLALLLLMPGLRGFAGSCLRRLRGLLQRGSAVPLVLGLGGNPPNPSGKHAGDSRRALHILVLFSLSHTARVADKGWVVLVPRH